MCCMILCNMSSFGFVQEAARSQETDALRDELTRSRENHAQEVTSLHEKISQIDGENVNLREEKERIEVSAVRVL